MLGGMAHRKRCVYAYAERTHNTQGSHYRSAGRHQCHKSVIRKGTPDPKQQKLPQPGDNVIAVPYFNASICIEKPHRAHARSATTEDTTAIVFST